MAKDTQIAAPDPASADHQATTEQSAAAEDESSRDPAVLQARLLRAQTELERLQEQLRLEQSTLARYRQLIDSAPLGIIEVDRDGHITATNPTILRLLGSPSAEQTRSINMFEYQPLVQSGIAGDFRLCFDEQQARVSDALYTTKWGKTAHYRYHMTPVVNERGEVTHVQALIEDFTQRQAAEQALRTSEKRLQMVVQHMPVLLNAVDEHGRIVLWNEECARVTGYSAAEMLGRTELLPLLYPDDDYREKLSEVWNAMHGEVIGMETKITRKNGHRRTVVWSIVSRTHSVPGWRTWAIGVDVSERKRSEEEREALIVDLRDALARVKTLRGLLPICANCKKIRDDRGYWSQIEVYISRHSDADFSHGICPDCAIKLSAQVVALKKAGTGELGRAPHLPEAPTPQSTPPHAAPSKPYSIQADEQAADPLRSPSAGKLHDDD